MPYSLLFLGSQSEYQAHYIERYCKRPVTTFDGYQVTFTRNMFYHAFYKSTHRDAMKDAFDPERALRIDWIREALEDPGADLRVGYDNKKKKINTQARVAIVVGNYVVVIRIKDKGRKRAMFVTAFVATGEGLAKILTSQKWAQKNRRFD